ncbi:MAG: glycoside hydrolase family 15 protein [bacterium]
MPRDIPIGNGNILIAFDRDYRLREFSFPHVGQESHVGPEPFRFGVWIDGIFSWIPEGWKIRKGYLEDSLVTEVHLIHEDLDIQFITHDLVDFHENIYLRKITIENMSGTDRDIRIFFCHDFHIYGNNIGDTAAFRPEVRGIVHYKNERYFLVNVYANTKYGIDQFATGNKEYGDFIGTWKDAEDGILSGNPISQGSVDSVIAIHLTLKGYQKEDCYYWICAGKSWSEVNELNTVIMKKKPETILKRTLDYWTLWLNKEELNFDLLPPNVAWLYKRSLIILRTQIDNCGSIMAANDSDVVYFNRDTYSYMWPRDGALIAYALDLAGYPEITCRFFNLCAKIIEKEGYFFHKYTPSGMLASSWHPWLKGGKFQLPIQEDETALVIWALWNHYQLYRDIEFIKFLYKPLIKRAADFMMNYRDSETKLPLPSYDLWEERQGILTFTVSAVYGGLMAAANFTRAFGETELAGEYQKGAEEIREAMERYLYLKGEKRFARMVHFKEDERVEIDAAIDASLYGVFAFGAFSAHDEKVASTMQQVYERLWCKTHVGGIARNEDDYYHRVSRDLPGNPWIITTLWLAQYAIAKAESRSELDKAMNSIQWVVDRALPSGVLAEQVHPYTNAPLSVSPLSWSHAAFIMAVQEYLNKYTAMERCPSCGQSKFLKKKK